MPDPLKADLSARQLVMSAFLYYRLSSPVLTDAAYDKLSIKVAKAWDVLSPLRQWQLGSPEDLQATGSHIKVTTMAMHGALAWLKAKRKGKPDISTIPPMADWNYDEFHRVRWINAE